MTTSTRLHAVALAATLLLLAFTGKTQTTYSIPNSGCSTCDDGSYSPVNICNSKYSAEADIFPSSSLTFGTVTKMAYYQESGSQTNVPIKIYMASSSSSTFSADGEWSTVISGATLVYSGNFSFTSTGWVTITLTTPFNYSSGNLQVMIETDWGTTTVCSGNPIFAYYQASGNSDEVWDGTANSASALQSETGGISDLVAPIQLTITPCSNPTISSQPSTTAQNYCQNATATALSLTASGSSLTYQWYSNTTNSNSGGTSISGATSNSYTPSTSTAGTLYYYCVVNSIGCNTTSNVSGAITINTAPSISSQSTGTQTVCQGITANSMSVTATGTNLNYQWYSNTSASNSGGTAVSGATSSSYTPSSANAGTLYYYCVVSNTGCTAATSAVSGAIVINATPATPTGTTPQVFCSSSSPTVANLTATGTSIQWYAASSGGSALAGTTALTNATTYYATQTVNSCQSLSRLAVTATVNTAPSISSQNTSSQILCQNSTAAQMSVTATGTSLTYQWYSNTANSNTGGTLITGATSSAYTPSTANTGTLYYYCVVGGASPCASVTSNVSGAVEAYLCNISGIAAGGDLSGTYPNPTVAKINGNTVPANADGYLHNDGQGNLAWDSGGVFGSGTANTVPVWTTSAILGNSPITINGSNVGIGTTSPGANLSVNGSINYTDGNQAAGKVLTSDANGNATWQSIGATASADSIGQWILSDTNIYYNKGYVGIGTTSPPAYPLQVEGNAVVDGIVVAKSMAVANSIQLGTFRFVNGALITGTDTITSNAQLQMVAQDINLGADTINMGAAEVNVGPSQSTGIRINGTTSSITSPTGNLGFGGNNLSTTGTLNSASLNVSGKSIMLPGDTIADTNLHFMSIDMHGNLRPVHSSTLYSLTHNISPPSAPCGNGVFGNMIDYPDWEYSMPGIGYQYIYTNSPCTWVGIGTSSPDAALCISAPNSTHSAPMQFSVLNPFTNTDAFTIDYAGNTLIAGNLSSINGASYSWPTTNAAGILTSDASGNLSWGNSGATGAWNTTNPSYTTSVTGNIWYSGGNVGINTSSPQDAFQVNDNINKVCIGSAMGSSGAYTGGAWGETYIGFNVARQSSTNGWQANSDGANNGGAFIMANTAGSLYFVSIPVSSTPSTPQQVYDANVFGNGNSFPGNVTLFIGADGYIGIGNTAPAYPLDVNGVIRANEFRSCPYGGCDFVFDNDYKLMSLDSLNAYLKFNHHLPGVASAKQMEEEGSINLGEMDRKLLQKVEELTLYIIQQQQDEKKQEQQAKEQDEKIKELQEKLEALTKQIQKQ